ncbi:MAG: phage major capsid protein [Bacteroidetes bacterium]|nr:phage major capsid protein [Bacteroidota bacterium]
MSTQPLFQQLREAREARAQADIRFAAISAKLGTPEWVEDTDGPAFETEQRNINSLDQTISRLTASVDILSRAGGAASTDSDSEGAPEQRSTTTVGVIKNRGDSKENARKNYSLIKAIQAVVANRAPEGLEGEMMQEAANEARSAGGDITFTGNLHIPSFLISQAQNDWDGVERRDITANTGATGGYTIETALGKLIEFLYPRLSVLDMGATYFGNQTQHLSFPRNSSAAAASWASTENATASETTPGFELLSLTPKRLTAFTDVSKQNIVQSNLPMENFIRRQLNMAVMQALDIAAINGAGASGVPQGVMNVSGIGDIDLGTDGGLLDWARIVEFETKCALENADMGALGYITTPGVAGYLKTEKRDVAGNGFIWEGPNRNATVNGYRALASNNVPKNLSKGSGTNLHAMIFGNWADLIISQWGGIDLLVNPYTKGKDALVELIIHSWYDLGVAHNKSFTVCNEIEVS